MKAILLACIVTLAPGLPALAQDHAEHAAMAPMAGMASPAAEAYAAANMQMHGDMDITYTGDADVDFIKGMIPHHQGAVAMAKIVLEYGTDPEVKKLAEGVIAAQEAEIAWMKDWLTKHGQ